jgi:hypothetical protein
MREVREGKPVAEFGAVQSAGAFLPLDQAEAPSLRALQVEISAAR